MKKNEEILKNIKQLRLKKGYSQKEMAERLNLSVSGYGKIENGENYLSVEFLIKICNILEIKSYNEILPIINKINLKNIELSIYSTLKSHEKAYKLSETIREYINSYKEEINKDLPDVHRLLTYINGIDGFFELVMMEVNKSNNELRELLLVIYEID